MVPAASFPTYWPGETITGEGPEFEEESKRRTMKLQKYMQSESFSVNMIKGGLVKYPEVEVRSWM